MLHVHKCPKIYFQSYLVTMTKTCLGGILDGSNSVCSFCMKLFIIGVQDHSLRSVL